jgi:hypothetical protein
MVTLKGIHTEVWSQPFSNCHGGKITVDYDIGIVSQGVLKYKLLALK